MANSKLVHGLHSEMNDWLRSDHPTQRFPWRASQRGHKCTPPVTQKSTLCESNDQQRIYAAWRNDYSPAS
jgi:hypothetical protein